VTLFIGHPFLVPDTVRVYQSVCRPERRAGNDFHSHHSFIRLMRDEDAFCSLNVSARDNL